MHAFFPLSPIISSHRVVLISNSLHIVGNFPFNSSLSLSQAKLLATPEKTQATSLSRFSRLGTVRDIPPYRGGGGSPQSDVADYLEATKDDVSFTEPSESGMFLSIHEVDFMFSCCCCCCCCYC